METNRRKDKAAPGKVRKILIIVALVLLALAAVVLTLQKRVKSQFAAGKVSDVISAEVVRGSISTSVSGSGILSDDDVEEIEVPAGVELSTIHVHNGDTVKEDTLIAGVNLNTVLTAMNTLNGEIDALDKEIASAADETVSSTVSSTVRGRIKTVYAQKGDSVVAVMGEHGALCVLSMDGTLSFDVDAGELAVGDALSVRTGGKTYSGTVTKIEGGTAAVSIPDNGPLVGESAEILSEDGTALQSGELYITSPLRIVGYAGTVNSVSAAENRQVYAGAPLFTLTDTAYTANYETLLKERQDKEAEMRRLIAIYRSGGIYAPFSGTVKSVDAVEGTPEEQDDGSLPDQSFSVSPDATMSLSLSVDESEILTVSVGQNAVVTLDSMENESFPGTVRSIDRVGASTNGVTVYTAEIEINKADGMLSGMSASATITIEGVEDALTIPLDALQKTRTGYYVFTSKDEEGHMGGMKEVTVGISNANYVEITSGLTEGETVYYTEKAQDFFTMFMGGGNSRPNGGNTRPGGMPNGGSSRPQGNPGRG